MNKKITNFLFSISKFKKKLIIISLDLLLFFTAHVISNFLRSEIYYFNNSYYFFILIISLLIFLITFQIFSIYNNILRSTNFHSIKKIFYAISIYLIFFYIFLEFFGFHNFPRSIGIIQPLVLLILIIINRYLIKSSYNFLTNKKFNTNIIIYGAGEAGIQSINLFNKYNIINFIDDDINKQGRRHENILILDKSQIKNIISKYDVKIIFIAIPSLSILLQRKIIDKLKFYKVEIRILPNINDLISNKLSITDYQQLNINELLGRATFNYDQIDKSFYDYKTILITGGGGSIGSEIARQILLSNFSLLIIIDHSEINLYNIKQEIENYTLNKSQNNKILFLLGNITDKNFIENIFQVQNVNIVFHAAAYKHVNIVEDNVTSSVKNNFIGTYNLSIIAKKYKIQNFIFISTDKAVRPTNIMGASKRLAEICIQYVAQESDTIFSVVRFGNVIGSSGSVIPIFTKKIRNKETLKVTDKNVERFFMTIPEAVGLVLQASIISKGGETFLLNMGKPIKIYDIAKKMIQMSNHSIKDFNNPFGDISIEITGLKKGEKMYEELSISNDLIKSSEENILIDNYTYSLNTNIEQFINEFNEILVYKNEKKLIELIKKYVEGSNIYL